MSFGSPGTRKITKQRMAPSAPTPCGEGGDRSYGQADGGVEKPDPLPEQIAAQDACHFTWDRRNDDLESLHTHEDDRSQNAPLPQRVLEEAFVHIEPDEELVRRSIALDEPRAISDERSGDEAGHGPRQSLHAAPSVLCGYAIA